MPRVANDDRHDKRNSHSKSGRLDVRVRLSGPALVVLALTAAELLFLAIR